jgi:hypothetical protein
MKLPVRAMWYVRLVIDQQQNAHHRLDSGRVIGTEYYGVHSLAFSQHASW